MAEFKFSCPHCDQHIQCDTDHSGMQINCPTCEQAIVVPPAPSGTPTPPPAPAPLTTNQLIDPQAAKERYDDIKNRFEFAAKNYHAIKSQTENKVVRWRYSVAGQLWDYQPVWQGITRAYMTTAEIKNPDEAKYAYGYDATGRVICTRHYDTVHTYIYHVDKEREKIPHRELRLEYFVGYKNGFMEIIRYLNPHDYTNANIVEHICQFVERVWKENENVVEMEQYRHEVGSDYLYMHNLYHWVGEKLIYDQALDTEGKIFLEFVVDGKGGGQGYYILKNGERFQVRQPLPDGVTVEQLLENVYHILLERIPRAVQLAQIKEPIYCIVLNYEGTGNKVFDPGLSIGFESKRQAWLQGNEVKWWEYWRPAKFKGFVDDYWPFDDDELLKATELLNTEFDRLKSTVPGVNVLINLAVELEKLDWSQFAPITPDFCVVAAENDLSDLYANLQKIISPKKLAALEAAGFIEKDEL